MITAQRAMRGARGYLRAALFLTVAVTPLLAQPPPPVMGPPNSPAAEAFDPTGYWVALISGDWRYRMIVPGRGAYRDVPLNKNAKAFADAWNPSAEEVAGKQCEAYGAPALMRQPTRLHIHWQDANTLQVDTDNGMQTRLLHFMQTAGPARPEQPGVLPPEPERAATAAPNDAAAIQASWQGYSLASWDLWQAPIAAFRGPFDTVDNKPHGSLRVSTDHLLPGLLRKNGVPYSARTTLKEYWQVHREAQGVTWMTIASTVDDPVYLQTPYIYDVMFKQEPDGSKWDPTPCSLRE